MQAPDIANGTLYFAPNALNSWATEIQSVVFKGGNSLSEPVYLGHECRREKVPGNEPSLKTETNLILTDSPGEFIPVIIKGRFFEIPLPDSILPESVFASLSPQKIDDSYFITPRGMHGWLAEADCPLVPVDPIGYADLLNATNKRNLSMRGLYLRFGWEFDGVPYQLFAPCRYLNFANFACEGDRSPPPYLQPITGYALIPFKSSYLVGYLVARCSMEGCIQCEFVTPQYVPAGPSMVTSDATEELHNLAQKFGKLIPAYSRIYNAVIPLQGEIDFFKFR